MKYIKNTVDDIRAIFEERITADAVAEEFVVWDASMGAAHAREELARREFDIVGVGTESACAGYVRRDDLHDGVLGDYLRSMTELPLLSADVGLHQTVERVFAERRVIVRPVDEGPLGIITRGDMNKAPVRMWLFSLLTLLEMQMLRVIRDIPHAETVCQTELPTRNMNEAFRIYDQRVKDGSETDLLDCLYFGDKVLLLERASCKSHLSKAMGIVLTEAEIASLRKLTKLRNDVAHGTDLLLVHAKHNLPETARRTEELLARFERIRPPL